MVQTLQGIMTVTIARACPEDLPALAEINRLAYFRETVAQFAFKDWQDSGIRVQKVGRDSNSASYSFFPRTVISDTTNDL